MFSFVVRFATFYGIINVDWLFRSFYSGIDIAGSTAIGGITGGVHKNTIFFARWALFRWHIYFKGIAAF